MTKRRSYKLGELWVIANEDTDTILSNRVYLSKETAESAMNLDDWSNKPTFSPFILHTLKAHLQHLKFVASENNRICYAKGQADTFEAMGKFVEKFVEKEIRYEHQE